MLKCFLLSVVVSGMFLTRLNAQSMPSVEEAEQFFNNQKLLITYRDGEVIYGTYYFLEIHYCPGGQYGLYGHSVKQTILGNEQKNNWQEFGTWKIMEQSGMVGIYYMSNSGVQEFVPLYKDAYGNLFIREGVSVVNQGQALCY